ncbi:MAG: hypothetical protein ABEJ62_01375 [Candidatus Nanohaloarchaea archaeon]
MRHRAPDPDTVDPRRGGKVKIKNHGREIEFGEDEMDLSRVSQIAEDAQVRSIGDAVFWLKKEALDGSTTLKEALDRFDELVENGDLMEISPYDSGDYAAPRRFEVAAALNRLEDLECRIE